MREDQIQEYRAIHESNPGYGRSAAWADIVEAYVKRVGGQSVLDFGTGKGLLVERLREKNPGFCVVGYDPAVMEFSDQAVIHPGSRYDVVTSIDVLEHCPPGTIKPELTKLRDLAAFGVFLVISCREATAKLSDGRNAHLSVHPPEWWEERVDEVFAPSSWERYRHAWIENNRCVAIWIKRRDGFSKAEKAEMLSLQWLLGKRSETATTSIAVVGNGPTSPEDLEIVRDSDIVIRFNDWNRRKGFREDHTGDRCDVLFTQFDINHDPSKLSGDPRVCIAIPSPFKQDQIMEKCDQWYPEADLAMFNPYLMRRICRDVLALRDSPGYQHPIPTVGFQMLYWLAQVVRGYHSVFVTGFTWHVDQESGTVASCDVTGNEFPMRFNHSYLREAKWCAANLIERPNFKFSKSTQEALYWVRWKTTDQVFEKQFHAGKGGDWRYDESRWLAGKMQLQPFIDQLPHPDSALDLGSGPRSMVEYIAPFGAIRRVACLDPLMDQYLAMGKTEFSGNIELRSAPAEEFQDDFRDAFDLVWCHNVLDHCFAPRRVIVNLFFYLQRGGTAYIATDVHAPHKGHLGIDFDLEEFLRSLGLEIRFKHLKTSKSEGTFVRDQTFIVQKP